MAEDVAVVDREADPPGVELNLSMESIWCMIVFVRIISVNKLNPITLLLKSLKPGAMPSIQYSVQSTQNICVDYDVV